MRCKDCKHFVPDQNRVGFGECTRWRVGYNDEGLALNECLVEGDEGWGMLIGEEFGCVLYEPRQT